MEYNEDFFDDLDNDLSIRPLDLDKEWLQQASLYMKYAGASAYYKKKAAHAKEKRDVVEAAIRAEANNNSDTCLGEGVKPIAANIDSYVRSHPNFREAKKKQIEAEYLADLAMSAVFAFNQRKDTLENLVRLASMEWFASPTAPKDINRDFESKAMRSESSRKVHEAKQERAERPRRKS